MAQIAYLKAIQVFDVVARTGNLTQAAASLAITQSAISYHLRILETKIGARLFERTSRGVRLTEPGEKLVPFVREGLRAIETGLALVTPAPKRPVVRVAVLPMFASRWLAPRLVDFWNKHPKIELAFSHDNDTYSVASDRAEVADIAVQWGTGGWPHVDSRRLLEAPLVAACSPKLLKKLPLRAAVDLKRHTLLHVDDHNMWLQWLTAIGLSDAQTVARRGLMMSDRHFQLSATLNAVGVSLFIRSFIQEELRQGTLVSPLSLEVGTDYAYYLVRPKDRKLSHAAAQFHDWICAQSEQPEIV
jgi:LysR family transcriptional regulator, glycine cleavage system transcriptional activator